MKTTHVTPRVPGKDTLWLLTVSPVIWAGHFLLSYVTAAIWCARFAPPGGSLGGVRSAVAVYTIVALTGITITGWEGFRRHSAGGTETTTHDLDSPEDRHRFLGFATLLLSGLSAVATAYVAFATLIFETCR